MEVADDVLPRWITKCEILDYGTIVGADKFENMFVCRLGEGEGEDVNENFFTYKFKWEAGYLNGAACKVKFLKITKFLTVDSLNRFVTISMEKLSTVSKKLLLQVQQMKVSSSEPVMGLLDVSIRSKPRR